jgi:uncharacterized protein YndB with AHSA1/START domain
MNITVETLVQASPAKTWGCYTNPEDVKQWNFASDDWHCPRASADLREGGKFSSRMEAKDGSMGFDFEGTYTLLIPEQRIEYAFGDRVAVVEFIPMGQSTQVRVTFEAETTFSADQQREGWQAILNNFAKHVVAG